MAETICPVLVQSPSLMGLFELLQLLYLLTFGGKCNKQHRYDELEWKC